MPPRSYRPPAPGSRGGRRTMMTGSPSSRAAISLASVAAPPLALHTSTSIAWRRSIWRSPARLNGPRPSTTSCDDAAAISARLIDQAHDKADPGDGAKAASDPAPTVSQARRPTRPTSSAAASTLSTSIQRSSGWRRHGGRSNISRGTPARSRGVARGARDLGGERVGRIDQPVDRVLQQIGGEPGRRRRTRRSAPRRRSARDGASARPAPW